MSIDATAHQMATVAQDEDDEWLYGAENNENRQLK